MQLLITVSNSQAGSLLEPLLNACVRAGCEWGLFLTNDAAKFAAEAWLLNVARHSLGVVVCQESWTGHMQDAPCSLTLGSQSNHSEMIGQADRVISL